MSVVQNATTSLADDVAVTRRTLAQQRGPSIWWATPMVVVITGPAAILSSRDSSTLPPSHDAGESVARSSRTRRRMHLFCHSAAAGRLSVSRQG